MCLTKEYLHSKLKKEDNAVFFFSLYLSVKFVIILIRCRVINFTG